MGTNFNGILIRSNDFQARKLIENVICKLAATLSRPRVVFAEACWWNTLQDDRKHTSINSPFTIYTNYFFFSVNPESKFGWSNVGPLCRDSGIDVEPMLDQPPLLSVKATASINVLNGWKLIVIRVTHVQVLFLDYRTFVRYMMPIVFSLFCKDVLPHLSLRRVFQRVLPVAKVPSIWSIVVRLLWLPFPREIAAGKIGWCNIKRFRYFRHIY